ncbi:MAG: hypothetical protein EBE86_017895 [Hormoscilla sp. GUM202]|nr:hypothetical protein [Hormoscilla sp. GUM202]
MLSSNIYLLPGHGCSLLNKGRSHVGAIARGLRNRVSYTKCRPQTIIYRRNPVSCRLATVESRRSGGDRIGLAISN